MRSSAVDALALLFVALGSGVRAEAVAVLTIGSATRVGRRNAERDGRRLAAAHRDGTARCSSARTRETRHQRQAGGVGSVTTTFCASDGPALVTTMV